MFEAAKLPKSEVEPGGGVGAVVLRPATKRSLASAGPASLARAQPRPQSQCHLVSATQGRPVCFGPWTWQVSVPYPPWPCPELESWLRGWAPVKGLRKRVCVSLPGGGGSQPAKPSGPSRSIKGTGDQEWLAWPTLGCRLLSLKPWVWDWRIGSPSMNCSWTMIQPKLQHWLPGIVPE